MEKEKEKAKGKPYLGWGFAPKTEVVPKKEAETYYVLEPAFTSGQMLLRQYKTVEQVFPCETERADPHHYPNCMNTQDQHHYEDFRRRSANNDVISSTERPADKALHDAVSDEMVTARLISEKGDTRKPVAPEMLALLQDEIKLSAAIIRELQVDERVDFSCVSVPRREHPSRLDKDRRPALPALKWALSGGAAPPLPPPEPEDGPRHGAPPVKRNTDNKWKWCLGGRQSQLLGPSEEHSAMVHSRSVPVMLTGRSLMPGNMGGDTSPFHGVATRQFGGDRWDGRMRGQRLARDGWAGTYPEKETHGAKLGMN